MDVYTVSDVIKRRFRFHLKRDPVSFIYLDFVNNVPNITIILSTNLTDNELAALEVKYYRLMQDFPTYVFKVLNAVNHWHRKHTTITIYTKEGGFM